jgi:formylglycine-generating enzyme required for sulfatase activity
MSQYNCQTKSAGVPGPRLLANMVLLSGVFACSVSCSDGGSPDSSSVVAEPDAAQTSVDALGDVADVEADIDTGAADSIDADAAVDARADEELSSLPDAQLDTDLEDAPVEGDVGSDATDAAPTTDVDSDAVTDADSDVAIDTGMDAETSPTVRNACGGRTEILFAGAPAEPLDACGNAGLGRLLCAGPDSLRCTGATLPPACDADLLGEPCGCGSTLVCELDGTLSCVGGVGRNVCGGCADLPGVPAAPCDTSGGRWVCDGAESMVCSPSPDFCRGGSDEIEPGVLPGGSCVAPCGPGVWQCQGDGEFECVTDELCNACGGSVLLAASPGAACGAGGLGQIVCDGADTVTCVVENDVTVCGADAATHTAPIGDECDPDSVYICTGSGAACVEQVEAPNSCGGTTPLDAVAGDSCGDCDAGVWICDGTDALVCELGAGEGRNACGGCAALPADAGGPCGDCGTGELVCSIDGESLLCDDLSSLRNACGGCGTLASTTSDECGPCGRWECDESAGRHVCQPRDPRSCVAPPLSCADIGPGCTELGRRCVPGIAGADASCGDCLSEWEPVGDQCLPVLTAPQSVEATDGESQDSIEITWAGVDGALAYEVLRDGEVAGTATGGALEFVDTGADVAGAPLSVLDLTTAGTVDGVSLSWSNASAPPGTTHTYQVRAVRGERTSALSSADEGFRAASPVDRYEVRRDTGEWRAAGTMTTFVDTDAPLSDIVWAGIQSSTNVASGVEVELLSPEASTPAPASWEVRAVNAVGAGEPSEPADGARIVGPVELQWERADSEDGPWTDWPAATNLVEFDTDVSSGDSRWYRVQLNAAGAAAAVTEAVEGRRALPPTLGNSCASDGECVEGEWCPPAFVDTAATCPSDIDVGTSVCAPRPSINDMELPFVHVPVQSGLSFMIGSPETEVGRSSRGENQAAVSLSRSFYMQQTELTQEQWATIMGEHNERFDTEYGLAPSLFGAPDAECTVGTCPVETVSFNEALYLANALSRLQGLTPCYDLSGCFVNLEDTIGAGCPEGDIACDTGFVCPSPVFAGLQCDGYRLPIEAEWEYAARAGDTRATYNGDFPGQSCPSVDSVLVPIAWAYCNSAVGGRRATHPVGGKCPNQWGLYDMLGNVGELTWNIWDNRIQGGLDPLGPASGSTRVVRGASFGESQAVARAARRSASGPRARLSTQGIRLVRAIPLVD